MRAVVVNKNGRLHVRDVPTPVPPRAGLLMRVTAVGICGSDLCKLGHAPAGMVLGHEVAGVVEEVGPGAIGFRPGDRITSAHHIPCGHCVYCRRGNESQCRLFRSTNLDPGGWAEYVALSPRHLKHVAFRVPASMDDAEASLTEPLGCCIRALRRTEPKRGETFVVIGLGPVGLMLTALLSRKGVAVLALDRFAERARRAAEWGAAQSLPAGRSKAVAAVMRRTDDRGADQVFLAAGTASTFPLALDMVRRGGKVHLFSGTDKGRTTSLNIDSIYKREIHLLSTYSSSPADLTEAFRLIRRRAIPVSKLISHRYPLSRIADGIDSIRKGKALKVILDPSV